VRTLQTPNRNCYLVLVAVAGVHALVIAALLSTSRSISLSFPTVVPITALFLKRPTRPRSIPRPQLNETSAQSITEPITLAPPALPVIRPSGPAIDWNAEANRSVAKILEPVRRISFGFPSGGQSAITLGVPSPSSPHYRGESYRAEGGEQIYWLSDHCYMASDPPSLFEPDFLKNARVSRIGCR
jgi:hypothetical protein